ncbi:MAG: regulatory protein RecX [Microgenomates group bacterium]
MEDEKLQKLIGAAIAYISIHPRSEAEIRIYLAKRATRFHMAETAVLEALERLTQLRLVDDAAYARMFVESRMRSRPKGERLIRMELKKKGVQSDIIEAICSENFTTEGEESSELMQARKAIEKKWRQWQSLPIQERKQKVYRFLASRGFSSTAIYKIIDERA